VNDRTPILVTGAHRSGTTWVGNMLAADGNTTYISEPLNAQHRPGVYRAPVQHWYTYITQENENDYLPAFRELLNFQYHTWLEIKALRSVKDFMRMGRDFHRYFIASMQGQRALIKDPFALFSAPWFAQRLNCKVVITVRHPAGFASSLKRLGWKFDFRSLLAQPLLMHDHLEADRAAMEAVAEDDIITQGALLWKLIYRFVHTTGQLFPHFNLIKHEDLSRDPIGNYQSLYQSLGMNFTDKVKDTILTSSSSENPTKLAKNKTHSVKLDSRANLDNWKRSLSPEEIHRIQTLTEGVSELFYSEEEWK
jgi:hypothetical protein